jgi:hypothetical protein
MLKRAQPFRTQTGLCRHSNRSLFAGANSAGKRFGDARDWAGFFGDTTGFRAAETAVSRVPSGKAAESQRLFRRRQEIGVAQECVVAEAVPFGPVSASIFPDNREKNREFREKRPTRLILTSFLWASSTICERIPCAIEQGIFSAEQGIFSTEQGSGAKEQRIARKRPFLTQLFCS